MLPVLPGARNVPFAAIGEADSRLRKPVTLNHAIHRLMVLDAIVEDPDLVWPGTAEEKLTI